MDRQATFYKRGKRGRIVRALTALLGIVSLPLAAQVPAADLPPMGPLGLVWEASVAQGSLYYSEVDGLLEAYESLMRTELKPRSRAKVGLKVNTRSGRGLSTPLQLLRATIEALESRGYARSDILIVDYSTYSMRQAGIMPFDTRDEPMFEGCPVLALDSEAHYDADWFYDSPLPPALQQEPQLFSSVRRSTQLAEGARERKSFLPYPLLNEVDFWINMPTGADDRALGIDGALANATLWNVSNSQRFLANDATASAAVAEIAAIPELQERMILTLMPLDKYQFIGGPRFNSIYTRSEPRLWLSSDPVALDRLLYDRMNKKRVLEGFPLIEPMPRQFTFAASLGLGVYDPDRIRVEVVDIETQAPAVATESNNSAKSP
ncbi:MAG: DUF362 domain-containing protein [Coraliomargarita sp.]